MAGNLGDCPSGGAAVDVPTIVRPALPPPLPKRPTKPVSGNNLAFLIVVGGSALFVFGFIVGRFSTDSIPSSHSSPSRSSSIGSSYYEREITEGVKAFDPNYPLTDEDKELIRRMSKDFNDSNPK